MRIMWFTNGPLPAASRHLGRTAGGSGYWMSSLLQHLMGRPDLQIDVVTAYPGLRDDYFEEDGIGYFVIGQPRFQPIFTYTKLDLQKCVEIVRLRNPDLVHIHGSERLFGLMPARKLIPNPCVISLQGFLTPCLGAFFGALSPGDVWNSLRLVECLTRRGLLWQRRNYSSGIRQEAEILGGNSSFIGHTDWDKAYVRSMQPTARYYHVQDMLRPPFYAQQWHQSRCERHTILFTHIGEPRRGTEVLLRALQLVRREFPDARLRLAGEVKQRRGYDRFVMRRSAEQGAVEFLGYLSGEAMATELSRAHVFAIASYVENGSTALCEAMLVGLPCVATYTSGILSNVEHGRTGLLFPPGDAVLLADAIMRIFRDDDLAQRLGRAARTVALERHAPDRIVSQLLDAYHQVLGSQPPCPGEAGSENRLVVHN